MTSAMDVDVVDELIELPHIGLIAIEYFERRTPQ
jgi:hypothetical protein